MNGERLRVAREACMLTQSALAEKSNVPASTVSKLEHGLYGANTDNFISAFSEALDTPASFFSDEPLPEIPDGRYRKQSRASASLKKAVVAQTTQAIATMNEADKIYKIKKLTIKPFEGDLDTADFSDLASELREIVGASTSGPIGNTIRTCERSGVPVMMLPLYEGGSCGNVGTKCFSAFSTWPDMGSNPCERPMISISSSMPGDAQRATVVHELAHLYIHTRNPQIDDKVAEKQAWDVTDRFLFPVEDAHERLDSAKITLQTLKRVKSVYGVSVKFLITCCKHYGLIDSERATSLYKQYTARRWNQGEPVLVQSETAQFFPSVIERMNDDGLDVGMPKINVERILKSSQQQADRKQGGVGKVIELNKSSLRFQC